MTVAIAPQFRPGATPAKPLRVLDEDGRLVDGAEPELDDDALLDALRNMLLTRALDARSLSLQRQGKLGSFAPTRGQEATILGPALALDPARDWVVPQYRELPALLYQGMPLERVILLRQQHPSGLQVPEGVNLTVHQISLAAQLPHAVGLAWGFKLKGEDRVVVTYFGDGASSEGDSHEAQNLAGVVKAPVIFVLQNNGWAISTPREIQSAAPDLAARAPGYGFPGAAVDGNDLLAMYAVTRAAVERARAGEGPTLIEARTYRMGMHNPIDDPKRYMNEDELARWEKRDPIARVQKYLAGQGRWDDEVAAATADSIAAEIDAAFEQAATYPPVSPTDVFEHVFAEPTPALERQRAASHAGE